MCHRRVDAQIARKNLRGSEEQRKNGDPRRSVRSRRPIPKQRQQQARKTSWSIISMLLHCYYNRFLALYNHRLVQNESSLWSFF